MKPHSQACRVRAGPKSDRSPRGALSFRPSSFDLFLVCLVRLSAHASFDLADQRWLRRSAQQLLGAPYIARTAQIASILVIEQLRRKPTFASGADEQEIELAMARIDEEKSDAGGVVHTWTGHSVTCEEMGDQMAT